MNLPRSLAPCALLVLFAGAAAVAQERGEKLCGECGTSGRLPHPHKPSVLEQEQDVVYCSYWMDHDPEALCLDWVVCADCLTPSVQARAQEEFDREFQKRKQWLESRREIVNKVTRSDAWHLETEHFLLAWDIPEIKLGRRIIRQHEAMHLYSRRAEELYQRIQNLFGIDDSGMLGTKINIYMLERQKSAKDLAPRVTDLNILSAWKVSKVGPFQSHMVVWDNPEKSRDDEVRHQFFVHGLSHHIFNDIHTGDLTLWMFKRYGWMYEGLAFHMESIQFGAPKLTCGRETGRVTNYRQKSWEALVKKDVLSGDHPRFQDVIARSVDSLNDEERRLAWSYVDYLIWIDAHRMPELLTLMKGPQLPTRDCLRQVFGMTVGQFVDGWREYVLAEYSLRPKKGPIVR